MAPASSPAPLRILIVRVGAMGDILHAMPAVALLRAWLPNAEIGWAIEPRWAALLQTGPQAGPGTRSMPLVDRLHFVETRQWSQRPFSSETRQSILSLRRELRAQHYDLGIDLQGSIRSAAIAWMSGVRQVVGSDSPREAPARWLYDRTEAHRRAHVVEQAAEIVQLAIAGSLDEEPALPASLPDTPLPRDQDAEHWCDTLLSASATPAVFLAPAAGWGAKQWPAERFGQLARELARGGFRVLVNASPPLPDAIAKQVLAAAHPPHAFPSEAQQGSIRAVAATLSQLIALLRRVDLVIAGDTGPLHLAAALQRPVIALFGPTDPARNGPYSTGSRVLRDTSSVTDHRRHVDTEAGLARISVNEVLEAALAVLSRPQPDRRANGAVQTNDR